MYKQSVNEAQNKRPAARDKDWYEPLLAIVGKEYVFSEFADLLAYGRDRWPYGNLRYRYGNLPGYLPMLVVMPGNVQEVSAVMRLMHARRQTVIAYGAGSGVLGGAVALAPDVVIIDMKRINKVLEVDEVSKLVRVEGGMNGERFEAYLNNRRLTAGHLPQSLNMSTVAGWAACRGAGQNSSRYGKIEDIVAGMKVVLPDGRILDIRPAPRRATGPGLLEMFLGSEGCYGIIVELTLRVWDYPAMEKVCAFGFKDYISGLEALRGIMQAGLRPAITRLYDEPESAARIAGYDDYQTHPCLAMLVFTGDEDMVDLEQKKALAIIQKNGGKICSAEPAHNWLNKRFESLSAKPASENKLMDTIEISCKWSIMPEVYEAMRDAIKKVNPSIHVGAHWSHCYLDGACLYMTWLADIKDEEEEARQHSAVWRGTTKACLDAGGSMSHHHGVGYMRGPWMIEEWGAAGMELLQGFKNIADPNHIMNPGKIGLR